MSNMVGLQKLSVRRPNLEIIEVVVTIFWLLYFLDTRVPPNIPASLINAASYLAVFGLVALHWRKVAYAATRNIPLLVFIGIAMLSLVWSADFNATLDINRGLIRTFLFGAYFAARYPLQQQMKILAWVIGLATILSLLVCLIIPGYGIGEDGWQGIFPYKNFMGRAMVWGSILYLIMALRNWKRSTFLWLGLSAAIFLAIVSRSSTSLLLLIILLAQMPLFILIKQEYRFRTILLSLGIVTIGIISMMVVANQELILVDVLGEGTTFNGRTPIWSLVIETVSQARPWLGYGYGGFWTSDAGTHVIVNTWASDSGIVENFNAHSVYVEMFANLGIIGLIIYGAVFISMLFQLVILLFFSRKIEYFWLLQFLLFVILASLADVGIGISATNAYGVISIAVCLSIAIDYQRLLKQQRSLKNISSVEVVQSYTE